MYARSALALLALPLLAAAAAFPRDDTCNGGDVQCCDSTQTASDYSGPFAHFLDVGHVDTLVGLTCSPLSVLTANGQSCNSQTVCCTNDSFNGVVALGCTPINVNL